MSVSITTLGALPDPGGVFTTANHDAINTNITSQNTNNTNLSAAIAALVAGGFSASDALTAHAGGTQAAALLLTSVVNRVSTVATAADSVKLPLAIAGAICIVINDAVNSLQAFGSGTDTINDVATATGIPVQGKTMAVFFCSTAAAAGKWYSIGQWNLAVVNLTTTGNAICYTAPNYQGTEGGANNALTCNLVDESGTAVTLAAGLRISLKIAHTLQAGANTLAINGGSVKNIKSHLNTANNIATAYASGSIIELLYDGTQWQDLSQ